MPEASDVTASSVSVQSHSLKEMPSSRSWLDPLPASATGTPDTTLGDTVTQSWFLAPLSAVWETRTLTGFRSESHG